jgi:hypothetical protein
MYYLKYAIGRILAPARKILAGNGLSAGKHPGLLSMECANRKSTRPSHYNCRYQVFHHLRDMIKNRSL